MFQNASAEGAGDAELYEADRAVVGRATQRALARRQAAYTQEVRRLLDAGLEVMRRYGTTRSPRVADILEEAGLSRDAFYRLFASKEDLVVAIVQAGGERLIGYLRHQMSKETDPAAQLRSWARGILSQAANPRVAHATRAVLWNGGQVADQDRSETVINLAAIAQLVVEPVTALGSTDPDRDAILVVHAVMGLMRDRLWQCEPPTAEDEEHLVRFCMAAVSGTASQRQRRQK